MRVALAAEIAELGSALNDFRFDEVREGLRLIAAARRRQDERGPHAE